MQIAPKNSKLKKTWYLHLAFYCRNNIKFSFQYYFKRVLIFAYLSFTKSSATQNLHQNLVQKILQKYRPYFCLNLRNAAKRCTAFLTNRLFLTISLYRKKYLGPLWHPQRKGSGTARTPKPLRNSDNEFWKVFAF